MKKNLSRLCILMTFLFMTFLTTASFARTETPVFSGEDLLKMCNSTYDTDYGMCAGYISAVTHILLTESIGGYRACNHKMVRSQQGIDIFRGYVDIFPGSLSDNAATAVAGALARAFPCL